MNELSRISSLHNITIKGIEGTDPIINGSNIQTTIRDANNTITNEFGLGILIGSSAKESSIIISSNSISDVHLKLTQDNSCDDKYNSNVGGLIGLAQGQVTISDTKVNNIEITGHKNIAAYIGKATGSSIEMPANSPLSTINNSKITANTHCAAGVIGYLGDNSQINFSALDIKDLNISARSYAGALIGSTYEQKDNNNNTINQIVIGDPNDIEQTRATISYNNDGCDKDNKTSNAENKSFGGLIGSLNTNMTMSNIINYSTFAETASSQDVGGLIGSLNSTLTINQDTKFSVTNNIKFIEGSNNVGGLIGSIDKQGNLAYSSNPIIKNTIETIKASKTSASDASDEEIISQNIGGLIGFVEGFGDAAATNVSLPLNRIISEVNTINATSSDNVGGVIGYTKRSVSMNILSNVIHHFNFDNTSGNNAYHSGLFGRINNPTQSNELNFVQNVIIDRSMDGEGFNSMFSHFATYVARPSSKFGLQRHNLITYDISKNTGILAIANNNISYSYNAENKWNNSSSVNDYIYLSNSNYYRIGCQANAAENNNCSFSNNDIQLVNPEPYEWKDYKFTSNNTEYTIKLFYYDENNKFAFPN